MKTHAENRYQWYVHSCTRSNKPPIDYNAWIQKQRAAGKDPDRAPVPKNNDENQVSRLRYSRHRSQAKFRGIEFNFTWEQWHAWWLEAGFDRNDPTIIGGRDRPCMCRYGDEGAYEPGNVYAATHSQNASDAFLSERPRRPRGPDKRKRKSRS